MEALTSSRRVVVAMSGGVDSSVAAARLVDHGYDVIGVTLHLWDYPDDGSTRGRCCAPEDQYDARRTADSLGIPHYSFDRREEFLRHVVEPFVESYVAGSTPSPCTACNRSVKMRELFAIADQLGATWLATGHYAKIIRLPERPARPWLGVATDCAKDQSYFLYALTPSQLERMLFPLGNDAKVDVRREALQRGIPGANKGESQEICFVPQGGYGAFVENHAKGQKARIRPGPIVDASGNVVGLHGGIHKFTIGQRKGVGVAFPEPAFVTRLDAENATVHLGGASDLNCRHFAIDDGSFAETLSDVFRAQVKVRARHSGTSATVKRTGPGKATVCLDDPVRAVTLGQVMVAYDNNLVIGGGKISQVFPVSKINQ